MLARLCRAAAGSRWRRWLLRWRGGGGVSVHSVSRAGSGCSRGEAWGKRLPPDRPRPRPILAAGSSFQNARDRGVTAGPCAPPAVLAPQPLGPAPWSVSVRVLACVRCTGPRAAETGFARTRHHRGAAVTSLPALTAGEVTTGNWPATGAAGHTGAWEHSARRGSDQGGGAWGFCRA